MHRFALFALALIVSHAVAAKAPFLWEIEKDGRASHIMGTVHSSHPLVREIPDPVFEALRNSVVFLPELELSPQNIGRMLAAAFDWEGSRLEERLPEELYVRVRDAVRQLGLPELMLRNLSFEMLPFLLAQPPGENFTQVIDVQLYQKARAHDVEVVALETIEEQLDVFADLDEATTVRLIENALEEIEEGYPSFRELIETYATGDADAVYALVRELGKDIPEAFHDALLNERNKRIAERALPHLDEGGAFIAVGLAHLLGDDGIIALLREQGYSVERIPAD